MNQRVLTTIDGGVAHVQLNRAEKRNGLDMPMFEALVETGKSLAGRTDVRAVVLSGQGQAFCAGLDFMSMMAGGEEYVNRMLERDDSPANLAQRVSTIWQEVPAPVIAAVHGVAFGGGLQIALGADIRIVAPDAQLSVMEITYGLIPDMGITQSLLDLVGLDVAKDLVFTGRRVSGLEAHALGLATFLDVAPVEAALKKAHDIAKRSPQAIRASKRLLNECRAMGHAEALKFETELQMPLLGSPNQMEAAQAKFMKREPKFVDPEG